MSGSPKDAFPKATFKGKLRPSQADVVKIAEKKLAAGGKQLHIVAPPGSGKTVLGLYIWAMLVRKPCVVLSPNSAIQMQWAARTDLFDFPGGTTGLISTDPLAPATLTSLTYQSLTLPQGGSADGDALAIALWQEQLIEKGQAETPDEAKAWIDDLAKHNAAYYERRLSTYRKTLREEAGRGGKALATLHQSSRDALRRLKEQRVGLIILDECHHLLGHWGRVLADAHDLLEGPVIVGLTATPPDRDGHDPADVKRYDEFFGPVDYEVPVPAVVKDGFLAPYQDLAYFVRPSEKELGFIANTDEAFHRLVDDLCRVPEVREAAAVKETAKANDGQTGGQGVRETGGEVRGAAVKKTAKTNGEETQGEKASASARKKSPPVPLSPSPPVEAPEDADAPENSDAPIASAPPTPLPDWLVTTLRGRKLPTGKAKDWVSFEKRDPLFVTAARHFLVRCHVPTLPDVPPPELEPDPEASEMQTLVPVLDRYIRHYLRRSSDPEHQATCERAIRQLRLLGVQVTETGTQACASPVSRVLAYSSAKAAALTHILRTESEVLGPKMRAVVVADYEKTSAVSAEVAGLLDAEAGGAVAAFRTLLSDPHTDSLDPVLVTGSSLLIDDDLVHRFQEAGEKWLAERKIEVKMIYGQEEGFHVLSGEGADWSPRTYVAMVTELFQQGVTRCLVGTRGLLGEGWDASKVNVLIDLTTVTTSMTVNQLRGRSIRLDSDDPQKLSNNWDVVCLAPEFTKGLDDYRRFLGKHVHLYGVTEDGAVEKGVGHVHPAFTELRPEGVEGSMGVLNADMLARAGRRDRSRELWKIGQPFRGEPVKAIEAKPLAPRDSGFPPFYGSNATWSAETLTNAVGQAVLAALQETDQLPVAGKLHIAERSLGYVRAFLEQATEEESDLFAESLAEALGPLDQPRYVIPRDIDQLEDTWLSAILPEVVGRYFQRRVRRLSMLHAVPTALAKTKETAAVYEKHWNRCVSPGKVLFAHRGEGQEMLDKAKLNGWVPKGEVRKKEVFL